jgi:hypothetical protein
LQIKKYFIRKFQKLIYMKNINILFCRIFFVFLLSYQGICAQVHQGDIVLRRQSQVDSFRLIYGSITGLTGSLVIGAYDTTHLSDIHNLDSLSSIKGVGGSFYVANTKSLRDLQGLTNLNFVNGFTSILYNRGLQTLEGLDNLDYVGYSLYIYNNDSLQTLSGLRKVRTLSSDPDFSYFKLLRNPLLQTIGMESLQSVLWMFIEDNGLENLDGLDSLQSGGYIFMNNLPKLKSVSGLKRLRQAEGLEFRDCDALSNFLGFATLVPNKAKFGEFRIRSCDALIDMQGLEKLDSIKTFTIVNNQNLQTLNGLSGLTMQGWGDLGSYTRYEQDTLAYSYQYDLAIVDNPKLVSVGIPNLKKVGTLVIEHNISLTNLYGLESLEIGSVGLGFNPKLSDVNGINNLKLTRDIVFDNNHIDSLIGLNNLMDYREITYYPDSSLIKFHGLLGVDSTRGEIQIYSGSIYNSGNFQSVDILQNARHTGNFFCGNNYTLPNPNIPISLKIANQAKSIGSIGLNFEKAIIQGNIGLNTLNIWQEIEPTIGFDSLSGSIGLSGLANGTYFGNSFANVNNLSIFTFSRLEYKPDILQNLKEIHQLSMGFNYFETLQDGFLPSLSKIKTYDYAKSFNFNMNKSIKKFPDFPNVTLFTGKLEMIGNDSLTDCNSLCHLLTLPPNSHVTIINDNPYPCDSKAHILAWCDTINPATNLKFEPLAFSLSPNPASEGTRIEADGSQSGIRYIAVVNGKGQRLQEQYFPEGLRTTYFLSTEDFPVGIYQIVLQTEQHQGVRSLVVQR